MNIKYINFVCQTNQESNEITIYRLDGPLSDPYLGIEFYKVKL